MQQPVQQMDLVAAHMLAPAATLRVLRHPQPPALGSPELERLRQRCLGRGAAPTFMCYGRRCTVPRLELLFAPTEYRFSGRVLAPEPDPDPLVQQCLDLANAHSPGWDYDGALVNLYRSGADYVSEHRDDEPALAKGAPIFTFVFGPAQRPFQVRCPGGLRNFDLHHGMVGVMEGERFQELCTHGVPRRAGVDKYRLSITVRKFV